MKLLVLQQWYGLSDPELERQASNRIDFMHFLGYPEQPPDYSTVWSFRERLAATRTDELVWAELSRQLDAKGFRVRKGVAQDASFIEADPGGSGPRGGDARTRRSRDGDWAKRSGGSTFGYKLHVKTDLDHGLVRAVKATPASVHDSRVNLSLPGEVAKRVKNRWMHWSTTGLENLLNILLVRYCDRDLYASLKQNFYKDAEAVIYVKVT